MIGTESKLWKSLSQHNEEFISLERVESPITPGVSDVEYVARDRSGWVELKTCHAPRPGKRFTLHSPLTTAQVKWLLNHHTPTQHLYSYLLLAVLGTSTWKEFLVVEPSQSVLLVAGWKGVANEELRARPGVWSCTKIQDVVEIVSGAAAARRSNGTKWKRESQGAKYHE